MERREDDEPEANGENEEHKNEELREMARRVLIGRRIKQRKRAMLGEDCSAGARKVRKLDRQEYAKEAAETQKKEAETNAKTSAGGGNENEFAEGELEATIRELRLKRGRKTGGEWSKNDDNHNRRDDNAVDDSLLAPTAAGHDGSRLLLRYSMPFSSNFSCELVKKPCFPATNEYAIKLTVFRDLWRKGFYLASGTKFGCDYLAYEKPPGVEHSQLMVLCVDVNSSIRPLNLLGVSRVSTQVKKHVLLAVVSPGIPLPYYMEMNWWKGDGRKS